MRQKAHGCWITGRASLEGKQGAARGRPCLGDDKRTHPYSRVDEREKCLDCEWTTSPRKQTHYSAAKAGTTMVMKELARAYGAHGIRVNAIAPGAIPGVGFPADPATLVNKLRWDE